MRRRLASHLETRAKVESDIIQARKAAALRLAAETAGQLKSEFGAARVAIFGSLASGRFGPFSDVDLAVWGVPAERQAEAYCALAGSRAGGSLGPDIVFAESASPALLASVRDSHTDI